MWHYGFFYDMFALPWMEVWAIIFVTTVSLPVLWQIGLISPPQPPLLSRFVIWMGLPQHPVPGWRKRHRPKSASYCPALCGLTGLGEPCALSLSNHSKSQDFQLLEEEFSFLSLPLLPHTVSRVQGYSHFHTTRDKSV